ncbi:metal ABC transporter substrate-binding protein [Microbacterium sp. EYE_5]|uniref:zinc ABC transporter substrate-binding protein AztC n=1 Tax=unclassified Microbacterium TaxID=2609290 RepID=UPI002004D2B6|nr:MULTISPECIES: zinc ABC transporter substrate-binding protein AztC [unclassified Microbacterium]MCK6080069.1 metal ABC transporter substrate-binding protein [Microbacterium sp. EYE_382]MCK6085340.1 metal ABC transporter substrate-binding protein [Microbacterium sp. EYE_384]MCK6122435.1 metal ABC transporter substrate-binding protein [Microbacterium sp. EYE_80]MCK6126103.1 metal ABC transporter substrate-binding protein [Microbacterium sp. EYE_79]MCK6141024.1 metal ABC transporter substrate-b
MRRALAVTLAVASVAALVACAPAADDRPTVVATTNILGDIVENLAGDAVEVVTLMPPNADPHSFELSAREAAQLRDADLVVSNGLGLEEGVQHHVDAAAADGAPQFVAGDHVEVLPYAEGDGADPHFWTDPTQTALVVDALAPELAGIAGDGAASVDRAAAAYLAQLDELDAEMAATLGDIPEDRRALVTNHHVFGYLARRYDVRILGAAVPGGTTLAAPSASDLQELVDAIDEGGVRTIFADSSQPDRLMQVLADEAGRDVGVVALFTESLAPAGEPGDTYLDMMRRNLQRIADGLTP